MTPFISYKILLSTLSHLLVFISFGIADDKFYVKKSAAILSLNGQWSVTNKNGSIKSQGTVPGGIYTDLLRSGIIADPYYRSNDVAYRWIGRDDWTYSKQFDLECDILQKSRVILVTHGLDTVSRIFLNGKLIGASNNMFVRYLFDIKTELQASNNNITVEFQSPVNYAEAEHEKQLINYVIPPTCPPPAQNGECHVNYIRKMQSSFSWDWGPSFPAVGIWKDIEVIGFNTAVIRDVTVFTKQMKNGNQYPKWSIYVNAFLDVSSSKNIEGVISILLNDVLLLNSTAVLHPNSNLTAKLALKCDLPLKTYIKLWWPNGLGEQNLYRLKVVFSSANEISSKTVNIGFRTIELVQEPIKNSSGLSFYFRVNGVSFFAKGSNWIPADSFLERITPEYTRSLLLSAKRANMNMIRVWGGGIYETDEFYSLADELGLLIWQDMMFAVALYPANENFISSVTTETEQQIRRIQHHPCVLLWSGNNENEQGLSSGWWPVTSQRFEQYKTDYIDLYIKTIMPIIRKEDPSRPFLPSSPSNGPETEKEGWVASDPQDVHYGDVHFYTYGGGEWDWNTYPRARFVSEYGFQSYPSFENLMNVSEPEDWTYPFGNFMYHRQHHTAGNLQIAMMISNHMKLPSRQCEKQQAFEDMLYLSQIVQSVSIKTETERYRRSQSVIEDGLGKTMGALYWQLNDIWQAPSWSSIEYGGKWKMLHYYANNFFAPVLVSPFIKNESAVVFVVNEKTSGIGNATLNVSVYKWSSLLPTYSESIKFDQQPQCAQEVYSKPVAGQGSLMDKAKCNKVEECFLYFTVTSSSGKQLGPSNVAFLSELKDAQGLEKPQINVSSIMGPFATAEANVTFNITLVTDKISPFVWLNIPFAKGTFSDNGFLMVEKTMNILFFSEENIQKKEIYNRLTIKSLMDVCT